jgi:DNA-binding CsgD family transcriptional regulator
MPGDQLAVPSGSPVHAVDCRGVDWGRYPRTDPTRPVPGAGRDVLDDRCHCGSVARDGLSPLVESGVGGPDRQARPAVIKEADRPQPRAVVPAGLTGREVEVLRLAARGMCNREIGEQLSISARTVGHHLAHIYDKTGRRTRVGASLLAMEHGLLSDDPVGCNFAVDLHAAPPAWP